jgi:hypothetical protein
MTAFLELISEDGEVLASADVVSNDQDVHFGPFDQYCKVAECRLHAPGFATISHPLPRDVFAGESVTILAPLLR